MQLNKIYNEDCMEGMKRIEDKSVDMILTDIPYDEVNRMETNESGGIRDLSKHGADVLTFDLIEFLTACVRVVSGSIYIFCGTEQVSIIRKFFRQSGLITRHCIWEKTNPSPINGDHMWLSSFENCIFAKRSSAVFNEHCKSSVWKHPVGSSKLHPTQKPLLLFANLVRASSNEGMTILDPCIGSGTTAVAALKTKRFFIGFEKDEQYFKLAQARIQIEQRQNKLF